MGAGVDVQDEIQADDCRDDENDRQDEVAAEECRDDENDCQDVHCPIGHLLTNFTLLKDLKCSSCQGQMIAGCQIWGCEQCEVQYDVCCQCAGYDKSLDELKDHNEFMQREVESSQKEKRNKHKKKR